MYPLLVKNKRSDSYTKLLLHCNGNDGATSMKDYSGNDHQITFNGDAQLDTAQKKFGKSSALFDGDGDYLSVPDHADWNMGSDPFTIDFWIRFNNISTNRGVFYQRVNGDNTLYFYWDGILLPYKFYFGIYSGGIKTIDLNAAWSPSINTWYHVTIIRGWGGNANDWAICIDGTQIGSTLTDSDPWPDLAAEFRIGRVTLAEMNGWIDEFRVSKGIARWTANFTPPTAQYR